MSRAAVALTLALLASSAGAAERLGIIAVGEPPMGPDADLTELAHQLRAACRDRAGGVEEVATMRGRLLGESSEASLSELDRAYGGALAVYQNGEFESSLRTLRAIVDDLEGLPESEESYFQWKRGLLRLAHSAMAVQDWKETDAAFGKLARTELTLQPDPDQFSPNFRRRFEDVKGRVRQLPRRRLTIVAEGRPGTVYLNGRQMGTTPLTLTLPTGSYRLGGATGALRVPSFRVDLDGEDRTVVLDFLLAEAVRVNAGPGLALPAEARSYGIIRAGAWLGVDKLVVVSRTMEAQVPFLLGSIYDVRRGALLREGQVRMVAGSVPSINLAALASFLLTGQSSREVKGSTPEAPRQVVPPAVVLSPTSLPPDASLQAAVKQGALAAPAASTQVAGAAVASPGSPPDASTTLAPAAAPPPGQNPGHALDSPLHAPGVAAAAAVPVAEQRASTAAAPAVSAKQKRAFRSDDKLATPAGATSVAEAPPAVQASSVVPSTAAPSRVATSAAAPGAAHAAGTESSPPVVLLPAAPVARPDPGGDLRRSLAEPSASKAARPGRSWKGPVAIGVGALAVGATSYAVYQLQRSGDASADAKAMLGPTGAIKPGLDPADYHALRDDADSAQTSAYVSAGVAAALAATAGVLGWQALTDGPPDAAVQVKF